MLKIPSNSIVAYSSHLILKAKSTIVYILNILHSTAIALFLQLEEEAHLLTRKCKNSAERENGEWCVFRETDSLRFEIHYLRILYYFFCHSIYLQSV